MRLASGGVDGTVQLWDVVSGASTAMLQHSSYVTSVVFSPDGLLLASGSRDGTVRLWNVMSGANTMTLPNDLSPVNSVMFSPDGLLLASGLGNVAVRLWDVMSGANTMTLQGGLSHFYFLHSIAFSDDASALICHTFCDGVLIWDLASQHPCHIHPEPSYLRISYAGPASFARFRSRWIEVIRNSQMRWICWTPPLYSPNPDTLSMLGQRIAFGCRDGRVVILSTDAPDFLFNHNS